MKRFGNFCVKFNVLNPFPVNETLLCSFAAYLADEGLAQQTGKSYLAAVRNMQLSLGLPDPREQSSMPVLKRVQAGISRARMLKGGSPKIRLPITVHILKQLQAALLKSNHPERIVMWAIGSTAFFGFFRLGELLIGSEGAFDPAVHLAWGDVAIDSRTNPQMIQIHLKKSKCDQFGKGSDIILGRTLTPICPVSALVSYFEIRQDSPGPFFVDSAKKPITKTRFTQYMRMLLNDIGLPQHQYAGHSFRIGAATTAALAGIEDSTIQALGRWHSSAFLLYIRTPKEKLATFSSVLAKQ